MSFPKRLPPQAAIDPPGAVYTSPAPGGAPFPILPDSYVHQRIEVMLYRQRRMNELANHTR